MAKITIEATDAADLKQTFIDLFGGGPAAGKAPIKTPETKTPETKTPETKTPETKTPETKDGAPLLTYEIIMARIKKMKASTNPNIVSSIKVWKEEGGHPDLKGATPEQLALASAFLDTLKPE